jgi:hypothetical protein
MEGNILDFIPSADQQVDGRRLRVILDKRCAQRGRSGAGRA